MEHEESAFTNDVGQCHCRTHSLFAIPNIESDCVVGNVMFFIGQPLWRESYESLSNFEEPLGT